MPPIAFDWRPGVLEWMLVTQLVLLLTLAAYRYIAHLLGRSSPTDFFVIFYRVFWEAMINPRRYPVPVNYQPVQPRRPKVSREDAEAASGLGLSDDELEAIMGEAEREADAADHEPAEDDEDVADQEHAAAGGFFGPPADAATVTDAAPGRASASATSTLPDDMADPPGWPDDEERDEPGPAEPRRPGRRSRPAASSPPAARSKPASRPAASKSAPPRRSKRQRTSDPDERLKVVEDVGPAEAPAEPDEDDASLALNVELAVQVLPAEGEERALGPQTAAVREVRGQTVVLAVVLPPDDGRVNGLAIRAVSRLLRVEPHQVSITSGHTRGDKILRVAGLSPPEAARRLAREM